MYWFATLSKYHRQRDLNGTMRQHKVNYSITETIITGMVFLEVSNESVGRQTPLTLIIKKLLIHSS
jgi:hypothetical protein